MAKNTLAGIAGGLGVLLTIAGCGPRPEAQRATTVVRHYSRGAQAAMRMRDGLLEGRTIHYAPAGHIEAIQYFHRDTLEGPQYRFYPNGRLMTYERMYAGKLTGRAYSFFANGTLKSVENLASGQHNGYYLLFYARPAAQLHKRINYVVGDGREWKNGYSEYDTLGRLVQRYGFPQVRAAHDTVALGDSLSLTLRIRFPKHKLVAAIVGGYDEQFVLQDSASARAAEARGHVLTMYVPVARRGPQVLRGYVEDYDLAGPIHSNGAVDVEGQRLYFAYPYFVR